MPVDLSREKQKFCFDQASFLIVKWCCVFFVIRVVSESCDIIVRSVFEKTFTLWSARAEVYTFIYMHQVVSYFFFFDGFFFGKNLNLCMGVDFVK